MHSVGSCRNDSRPMRNLSPSRQNMSHHPKSTAHRIFTRWQLKKMPLDAPQSDAHLHLQFKYAFATPSVIPYRLGVHATVLHCNHVMRQGTSSKSGICGRSRVSSATISEGAFNIASTGYDNYNRTLLPSLLLLLIPRLSSLPTFFLSVQHRTLVLSELRHLHGYRR